MDLFTGSPSSSTHALNHIYDVFISFRGADTRNGFTDHLYNALLDAGFITFLDDEEETETGEPLKPELERAIKLSRASIIVLSKNYAFSTRCLDELVLILEQRRMFNQIVIPIFYHVERVDVWKQQSSFGEAMEKHIQRMDEETNAKNGSQLDQNTGLWNRALTQVSELKGKMQRAVSRKETDLTGKSMTAIKDDEKKINELPKKMMPRNTARRGVTRQIIGQIMGQIMGAGANDRKETDLTGKSMKAIKEEKKINELRIKPSLQWEDIKGREELIELEILEEKKRQYRKIETWKSALEQVAGVKGEDAKGRIETELIGEVITCIHSRLDVRLSNTLSRLIGMDHHIISIGSWVTDASHGSTCVLTIVGMDGIGKTSLARYVFGIHSRKFERSSFIEDINRRCKEQFTGFLDFRKQLHKDISEENQLHVNDVSVYTSNIQDVLARKRVFIVLDDIGSRSQLNELIGNKGLHPKSKIILTTKDASLRGALIDSHVQPIVSLNILRKSESLELLCVHAFKSSKPKQGYKEILEKLLNGCDGQPFVLQLLGSSLYMQDVAYWEDYIDVLQKESHFHIDQALKMSFNSLLFENDKDLFMHIACFFVGTDRDVTEIILNACDIYTRSGITNLIDRFLLSIGRNNELMMHQLVQDMGRDLVRQESPDEPWKRSRLWCHEESFEVLKQKKGNKNLIGLALDMRMLHEIKLHELETDSLSMMDNLMLLQLNYVQLTGSYKNFPKVLRWLCMHGFPLKSIPLDLPMENLVALDLSYSNIESFDMSFGNTKPEAKTQEVNRSLKILDLSSCEQLLSVGGFLEIPALERLIVRNCISLVEVCESVGQCVELAHIDLTYCYKLKKLPSSIGKLKKLETLLLDG